MIECLHSHIALVGEMKKYAVMVFGRDPFVIQADKMLVSQETVNFYTEGEMTASFRNEGLQGFSQMDDDAKPSVVGDQDDNDETEDTDFDTEGVERI